MDKRLVYGQQPKFEETDESTTSSGFTWCGMLRDEDANGESVTPLTQYEFEPAQLDDSILSAAKKLNVLFIWQKFHMHDLEFKRLLFADYATEVTRVDFPGLNNDGVYYEVGEVLPYVAIEPRTNKQIFFNEGASRGHPIENVLLHVDDAKYDNDDFKDLFSRIVVPYNAWVKEEAQEYHDSLFHQSYAHELFANSADWQTQVNSWLKFVDNKDVIANLEAQYKSFLILQIDRIVDELTRILSQPKDARTIEGFIQQIDLMATFLQEMHSKNKTTAGQNNALDLSGSESNTQHEDILNNIDEIIFDVDVTDAVENKLALQELFAFIADTAEDTQAFDALINLNNVGIGNPGGESLDLVMVEKSLLTEYQNYIICKMCLYFFKDLLETKINQENENLILDSHEAKLIDYAANAFVMGLSSLLVLSLQ